MEAGIWDMLFAQFEIDSSLIYEIKVKPFVCRAQLN